jgi:hypothetical protein
MAQRGTGRLARLAEELEELGLRQLGVRLVPSVAAEEEVEAPGGTRHTSGRRYSFDDPSATVIAVSADGPVSVLRRGEIVVRSPDGRTPG